MAWVTPFLVAVTGGIGSGKSTVASSLSRRCGFPFIDADKVAKELFAEPGDLLESLKSVVGERFFHFDGALNRPLLRETIFADKDIKRQVEEFSHPLIRQEIKRLAASYGAEGCSQIVIEVPLLFEVGWQADFDKSVVVYAEKSVCLDRLVRRDGLTVKQATAACGAQLSLADKAILADHVIDNGGQWSATLLQINALCDILGEGLS